MFIHLYIDLPFTYIQVSVCFKKRSNTKKYKILYYTFKYYIILSNSSAFKYFQLPPPLKLLQCFVSIKIVEVEVNYCIHLFWGQQVSVTSQPLRLLDTWNASFSHWCQGINSVRSSVNIYYYNLQKPRGWIQEGDWGTSEPLFKKLYIIMCSPFIRHRHQKTQIFNVFCPQSHLQCVL